MIGVPLRLGLYAVAHWLRLLGESIVLNLILIFDALSLQEGPAANRLLIAVELVVWIGIVRFIPVDESVEPRNATL